MRGIHRSPVDSPHKGPITRKMFPFDDVIMDTFLCLPQWQRSNPEQYRSNRLFPNHIKAETMCIFHGVYFTFSMWCFGGAMPSTGDILFVWKLVGGTIPEPKSTLPLSLKDRGRDGSKIILITYSLTKSEWPGRNEVCSLAIIGLFTP